MTRQILEERRRKMNGQRGKKEYREFIGSCKKMTFEKPFDEKMRGENMKAEK